MENSNLDTIYTALLSVGLIGLKIEIPGQFLVAFCTAEFS
jgi:hypothetical protein